MNENAALLNDIYRISQSGENLIQKVAVLTQDSIVRQHLSVMLEAYRSLNLQSLQLLHRYGLKEKELTRIQILKERMHIWRKIGDGRTPSRVAQLLVQRSTGNIIALTKSIRIYDNAHPDAQKIAKRLLHIEELNVSQLKTYL